MAELEDRVTVVFVNGDVYEVTASDPGRVSDLDDKDLAHISKNKIPRLLATRCEPSYDGKCYYYIGGRKVRCTCP